MSETPEDVFLIAGFLDYPSVYMGGPSQHSIRKAERILQALRAEGYRIEKMEGERND